MGDYFAHWLTIGLMADPSKLPKIYQVNWFRKDQDGHYLWPGFGENSRVLKWIFERIDGQSQGLKTPIGIVPTAKSLDLNGLNLAPAQVEELLKVDNQEWLNDLNNLREYFKLFGDRLPLPIAKQLETFTENLKS